MIRYTLVALAVLTMAAYVGGCQSSGHAEASVDTDRPKMADDGYTQAYVVRNDTSYMRSSTDTTSAGTLRSGDVVYLRSSPPSSGLVQAKTTDGRMVWVRASDLSPR